MKHVDPSTIAPCPSTDPHGFIDFARAKGAFPLAALVDGSREIVWRRARTGGLNGVLRADREGFDLVWEAVRARTYIAAARSCGLVLAPWCSYPAGGDPLRDRKGGVMETGESVDGPNDYGVATKRFMKHPDRSSADDCRSGMVFDVLCHEFGVKLDDPDFIERVREKLKAEDVARSRERRGDRKLTRLCDRAFDVMFENGRLEEKLSEATDAFDDVEKPQRPVEGMLPHSYSTMTHREALCALREARQTPLDQLDYWKIAALATGRFKAFVDKLKVYEVEMRALEEKHGLAAARKAAEASTARARSIVADIAAIPATTLGGLAAKCRLMNYCMDAGWGLHDEFAALAESIFDDGTLCGEMLMPTARPPRTETGQPAHH